MTCDTFGIKNSDVIDICEVSISIFHLNFIRENDLLDIVIIGYSDILDIVIIWPKIPCPWDYHYIQYVLYENYV